jgi:diguanylate cyclase (GGDEF)-like protein
MAEQVTLRERLQHQATHDSLTGLANRRLLHEELAKAIRAAERDGHLVALLDIDLDRFKVVNDGFGHPFGDVVLQAVARRLRALVCLEDTVARMGGDEFVILTPRVTRVEDIEEMAQRLVDSFAEPFVVQGRRIHLTGSVGISFYPRDGEGGTELIDNADMAMYYAKAGGRSAFRVFAPEMAEKAQRRTEMEIDLRRAADEGQLWLAYQPKVDLASAVVTGCEALLRWDHPEQGPVSPVDFIPIAEDSGLILPIGEWVLETACRQGRAWLDRGLPPVSIAVNISASQLFQRDPVAWVTSVLERTGFPAELLELELTESQLAQDVEAAIDVFGQLRGLGIRVAIDDFGTGYSSLDYLRRFDVTSLKIDRSFVDGMLTEAGDAAIVRAAIALAHAFGLSVTAEGVETEDQRRFLRELGCDQIQGYLVSRPVPAEEFAAALPQS